MRRRSLPALRPARALRAVGGGLLLALCAGGLAACSSGHDSAKALDVGLYSGTLPDGAPVTVAVDGATVEWDGRDTYLVDPTTTAQFVVADRQALHEWSCRMAEGGRSLHCDSWLAPRGAATPTALPCVAPGPRDPWWCYGPMHVSVDLLRICSTAGCSS